MEETITELIMVNTRLTAAISRMVQDLALCLSQQPGFDRSVMRSSLENLPVPNLDPSGLEVYQSLKAAISEDLG